MSASIVHSGGGESGQTKVEKRCSESTGAHTHLVKLAPDDMNVGRDCAQVVERFAIRHVASTYYLPDLARYLLSADSRYV